MRVLLRECVDRILGDLDCEPRVVAAAFGIAACNAFGIGVCNAFAIDATQHGVDQLARADAITTLRELDGLGDGSVRGDAAHEEQLIRADAQQIDHVGLEFRQSSLHAGSEHGIDPASSTEHAPKHLVQPAAITRIQRMSPTLEGAVQQITLTEVRKDQRGGCTGVRDTAAIHAFRGRSTATDAFAFRARSALGAIDGGHAQNIVNG